MRSDDMSVRAQRVVVAVPIAIAGQIIYEPMLSVDRSFLHQRMPSGAIFKINIVYDEPFWRSDGLSGAVRRTRITRHDHDRRVHRRRHARRPVRHRRRAHRAAPHRTGRRRAQAKGVG